MHRILTLAQDEIARFLLRHRRSETIDRYEPRLDHFLRELLAKANEFVPSAAGAILLDDPRAKLFGSSGMLTYIAAFGEHAELLLGQKLPSDAGAVGQAYTEGQTTCTRFEEVERTLFERLGIDTTAGDSSVLAVPVLVGNSICGVLQLVNRLDHKPYSAENVTLLEIFAGYISSSIQNALDAIRAREVARRDDLTGLYNDRYFHFRLREEIGRAEPEGQPLSLVFIDLDNFKTVNDRFGHLEGSRLLHEIGLLLQNALPPGAVAARYGGDEFVIILPNTDLDHGAVLAEQLRARIGSTPFVVGPASPSLSASFGVASVHEHVPLEGTLAQRANALIRLADEAMYVAKAKGKNSVVIAAARGKSVLVPVVSDVLPPK